MRPSFLCGDRVEVQPLHVSVLMIVSNVAAERLAFWLREAPSSSLDPGTALLAEDFSGFPQFF
jgi:hypothetical protein